MDADDPRHGRPAGYVAGCRRRCCKKGMADYENRRRMLMAAGKDRLVSRGGAVRRLRALQAIGWSSTELSARLNRSRNYVSAFVSRTDNQLVRADVFNEISDLYEQLCMARGPSSQTATRAALSGWLPPLAYEDIDLPAADNDLHKVYKINDSDVDDVLVQRVLNGDFTVASGANEAERLAVAAAWLEKTGLSLAELERRSGWNIHRDRRQAAA